MIDKKSDYNIPVHDIKSFKWKGKKGTGCKGDLTKFYSKRIFADAADTGFYVQGTHEKKLFTYVGALSRTTWIMDVYAWRYRSEDGFEIDIMDE